MDLPSEQDLYSVGTDCPVTQLLHLPDGTVKALLERRARPRVTILCPPGPIDAQYGWRGDQETQPLIPRQNWDPISGYPCCNDVCIQVTKA